MLPLRVRLPNIIAAAIVLVGLSFLVGVAVACDFPFTPTACLIVALGCAAPHCVRIIANGGRV